jgi:hypothetical protein
VSSLPTRYRAQYAQRAGRIGQRQREQRLYVHPCRRAGDSRWHQLERARAKVYPTVDVLTSRSRLLETKASGREHVTIANRVRKTLASHWSEQSPKSRAVGLAQERALKLQNYFIQLFCAEPWTKRRVPRSPTLRPCAPVARFSRVRTMTSRSNSSIFAPASTTSDELMDRDSRSVSSDAERRTAGDSADLK